MPDMRDVSGSLGLGDLGHPSTTSRKEKAMTEQKPRAVKILNEDDSIDSYHKLIVMKKKVHEYTRIDLVIRYGAEESAYHINHTIQVEDLLKAVNDAGWCAPHNWFLCRVDGKFSIAIREFLRGKNSFLVDIVNSNPIHSAFMKPFDIISIEGFTDEEFQVWENASIESMIQRDRHMKIVQYGTPKKKESES